MSQNLSQDNQKFSDKNYLFQTWTGRLVVINTIMFVLITLDSGSLFSPGYLSLMKFGAKETLAITHGEWWRLFTPMFLHIGIIHFLLNNAALRIIGRIIEHSVGGFWFLFIYLLSGIFGNICSTMNNFSVGAGASGAIFGLIGTGVFVEYIKEYIRYKKSDTVHYVESDIIDVSEGRKHSFKWIPGPFTFMALINIAIAIILNSIFSMTDSISIGIDNAAHLGGLFAGALLGSVALNKSFRQMKFFPILNKYFILSLFFGISFYFLTLIYETNFIRNQLIKNSQSQDPVYQYLQYSNWLKYDILDPEFRFLRGRLLIKNREYAEGIKDLNYSRSLPDFNDRMDALSEELTKDGDYKGLKLLEKMIKPLDYQ